MKDINNNCKENKAFYNGLCISNKKNTSLFLYHTSIYFFNTNLSKIIISYKVLSEFVNFRPNIHINICVNIK